VNDLHLTDRIPDVAAGRSSWNDDESEHLDNCRDCLVEWDLVTRYQGVMTSIDVDRVVENVVDALGAQKEQQPRTKMGVRRWLPIGLAAAASIALALTIWQPARTSEVAMVPLRAPSLLPELDQLLDSELELLLASIEVTAEVTADDYSVGSIPRLGDLTDSELELLLDDMENF
jgi:hypothetical protein